LLRASDDVGPILQDRRHQAGNILRKVLQVGRIEYEDVTAGYLACGAKRVGNASLAPVSDHFEERVLPLQLSQHAVGSIAGTVVHDDHFEGETRRPQGLGATLNEFGKVFLLVLGRDEHAYIQRLDRGDGHTRFRIRAGRIPS
jgi:hypothetical protein